MQRELRRKGVTLDLLWQEYKSEHPDGYQYSRFCDHYRAWVGRLSLSLRQTHTPGEKLFVDYAGPTVPVTDPMTGEIRQAAIFVAVLGASNYTYCDATRSQALPDWIGNTLAARNIESNLQQLKRKRVRAASASIRAGRSKDQKVITTLKRGREVFILDTADDELYEVYLPAGHTVGWIASSLLEDIRPAATTARQQPRSGYPSAPAPRAGYVTCNTQCFNGDCVRTYSDGKKVRFQAPRNFNPMSGQWEWDSGGC